VGGEEREGGIEREREMGEDERGVGREEREGGANEFVLGVCAALKQYTDLYETLYE
jgi:hypothetical protein